MHIELYIYIMKQIVAARDEMFGSKYIRKIIANINALLIEPINFCEFLAHWHIHKMWIPMYKGIRHHRHIHRANITFNPIQCFT